MGAFKLILAVFLVRAAMIHCAPPTFMLKANDSILFLGGMNVVTGGAMPYGFINVIKQEVQTLYSNITVVSRGFADDDANQLLSNLNFILTRGIKPTKAIISVGLEAFITHTDDSSRIRLKFELESLVARLKQDKIEVALCPLTIHGERVDIDKEMDDLIQLYTLINKEVAREYSVMHVNLPTQLAQYLGSNNLDKLDHSVLTLDGSILNEKGHMFVALALLRAFGVSQHSLSRDNPVLEEQLRVQGIKEETERVEVRRRAHA